MSPRGYIARRLEGADRFMRDKMAAPQDGSLEDLRPEDIGVYPRAVFNRLACSQPPSSHPIRNPDETESLGAVRFQGLRSSLELTIRQYQFPDIEGDEWDSNWLVVEGSVDINGTKWTFREPCLTNFETEQLANWLEEVSIGEPSKSYCFFTEPNLEFRYQKNRQLRICLALESGQPGRYPLTRWNERSFLVRADAELVTAARQLRQQLVRFPLRWPRPRPGR